MTYESEFLLAKKNNGVLCCYTGTQRSCDGEPVCDKGMQHITSLAHPGDCRGWGVLMFRVAAVCRTTQHQVTLYRHVSSESLAGWDVQYLMHLQVGQGFVSSSIYERPAFPLLWAGAGKEAVYLEKGFGFFCLLLFLLLVKMTFPASTWNIWLNYKCEKVAEEMA